MTDKANHNLESLPRQTIVRPSPARSHGWGIAICSRSRSMPHRVAEPRRRLEIDRVRVTERSTSGFLPQSCNRP